MTSRSQHGTPTHAPRRSLTGANGTSTVTPPISSSTSSPPAEAIYDPTARQGEPGRPHLAPPSRRSVTPLGADGMRILIPQQSAVSLRVHPSQPSTCRPPSRGRATTELPPCEKRERSARRRLETTTAKHSTTLACRSGASSRIRRTSGDAAGDQCRRPTCRTGRHPERSVTRTGPGGQEKLTPPISSGAVGR